MKKLVERYNFNLFRIFKMIRMNPDIGSDEMELTIVQCMDMRVPKDTKIFIDIEFPFPHVSINIFKRLA